MIFGACLAIALAALSIFKLDQLRRGRFAAAYETSAVPDRTWFDRYIASVPAEVIAAAVDDTVDAADVKALLARLMIEKKISAAEQRGALRLRLLVPWTALSGKVEYALARALFVAGDSTDLETIRQHYDKTTDKIGANTEVSLSVLGEIFAGRRVDVAAEIEDPLREGSTQPSRPVRDIAAWLYMVPVAYFAYASPSEWESSMGATELVSMRSAFLLLASLVLHLLSMKLADRVRQKAAVRLWDPFLMIIPVLAGAALVSFLAREMAVLFLMLFTASVVNIVMRARSLGDPAHSLERVRLGAGRDFLEREAASGRPIPEHWIPYFFAFGIAPRVQIEAKAFWACGGVERFSELADELLAPFSIRTAED